MIGSAIAEGIRLAAADDTSLVQRLAAGDAQALEQMVALYQMRVSRLASRLLGWRADVDDVVQDVFVAAMSKAKSFRGDGTVWTWLSAITVNRCRNQQRRAALFARFWHVTSSRGVGQSASADRAIGRDEVAACVREAVAVLSPKDREVIVLYYLEERPIAEIAAVLGASINAIEVRLHRARRRLKEQLGDVGRGLCHE